MPKQKWSFVVQFFAALVLLFNLPGLIFPQVAYAKALAVVTTPNPILFVTQIPVRSDFTTIGSVFGNHQSDVQSATRGGDLWIRYPDGTLKNLTQAAGFGSTGAFQDHNAIAVRDPSVYWDGTRALFSMVIGSPETQYVWGTYYWQIYEITDFVDPTHTCHHQSAQPARQLQQRQPDLRHRRPHHLYVRPSAQWGGQPVSAIG